MDWDVKVFTLRDDYNQQTDVRLSQGRDIRGWTSDNFEAKGCSIYSPDIILHWTAAAESCKGK